MSDMMEEGDLEGPTYVSKTDDEIKALAMKVFTNEVFTSLQVDPNDLRLLQNIFMPLALADDLFIKRLQLDKAYCFYADMSGAGPRTVNGYPVFFSVSYLDFADTQRLVEKYKNIVETLKNV